LQGYFLWLPGLPQAGDVFMTRLFVFFALASILFSGCAMTSPGMAPQADNGLSSLRASLNTQNSLIEQQNLRLDRLEQQVAEQQRQIGTLQAALAAQKVTPVGENTTLASQAPETEARSTAASPTETYLKAFGDYASGRYNQSIEGFETFLNHFPTNNYAGNAQFWLGECYYKLGQFARSVQEFQKVVDNYPLSDKAPDALLRMAPALRQLNQYEKARQALQTLQQRYPNSVAARKALVEP
jgi:tol-pal system protein YbgF